MLRMESRSSENSLSFSDKESPAWVKLWNSNYSSTGGLNIGSESDFASAIGDKEVAAKAVAFVVNSTRKGIVPLCADVANLLRAKRNLEDKIVQLSKENNLLKLLSDGQESLSGSTVTRSKHEELTDSFSKDRGNGSVQSCQCLHSSNANSTAVNDCLSEANSYSSDEGEALKHHPSTLSTSLSQPPVLSTPLSAQQPVLCGNTTSCQSINATNKLESSINSKTVSSNAPNSNLAPLATAGSTVVEAEVHVAPVSTNCSEEQGWAQRHHHRTSSLSSSERSSNRSLEMATWSDRQSLVCIASMSRQLNETVLSNSKLTEELLAARATVEKLQKEVRDFRAFCKSCSHEGSDVTSQQRSRGMNVAPDLLPTHQLLPADSELPLTANLSSCHVCSEVQKASKLNGTVAPHLYKHDAITLCTSDNMLVNLGDSILTFSNHCGTVRYIGHLDGFAPTCLFVGVQLADRVSGGLDGTWNGKRYFSCPNGRGIFIQPQDIVNVLSKKQASVIHKSKKPSKSRNAVVDSPPSSSSSRSAGAGGLVSKLRKAAVGIKHTYSQKRISLPDSTSSVDAVLPPECRQSKRQVDNHTNSTSTTPQY